MDNVHNRFSMSHAGALTIHGGCTIFRANNTSHASQRCASGGFFLSKITFSKPVISLLDQAVLMQSRGLFIGNLDVAVNFLRTAGYYHVSGYSHYFRDLSDPVGVRFRHGTTLSDVVDLYEFDRKLRSLFGRALQTIEIAVKAVLSHEGAMADDPFWLCNPANFDLGSHNAVLEILESAVGDKSVDNTQVFLKHFYNKYDGDWPPCWMIMEVLSFGQLSKIYKLSKGQIRQKVSAQFKLQHDVMESWLHSLAFSRNVCAHNGRIWNKSFTIRPKIPRVYQREWPLSSADKAYIICGMVNHLLGVIDPKSDWSSDLRNLIDGRPEIPLTSMGFPANWEIQGFWRFNSV